jgi:hypothetical protein
MLLCSWKVEVSLSNLGFSAFHWADSADSTFLSNFFCWELFLDFDSAVDSEFTQLDDVVV